MTKYLVTGGAGFIGSNLVNSLVKDGHDVTVWDRLASTDFCGNVNYKNIHIDKIDPLYQDEFDVIFHLAAESRIQNSFNSVKKTHNSNITGTLNILEIARNNNAKVIYAGSSTAYHDQYANPYNFTKLKGEEYCTLFNRLYDIPVAIARFFNVYGPRQYKTGSYANVIGIFENQIEKGLPLTITGNGEQKRDFIHVSDVVSGLIAMSKDKWLAEIFNLGTGKNYSINEVASLFNKPVEYIPSLKGEVTETLADISKTKLLLGWVPKISLEEYIKNI